MIDKKEFFKQIRPLFKKLSKKQVEGIEAIIDKWEALGLTDLRHLAYMLATTFHETARTMQPIAEYGKGTGRKYGKPGKHGQVAYGRGYVQLTWDFNYEKADDELGLGGMLIADYNLALQPDIAAAIMFRGMQEGWFTGKKLSQYFNDKKTDFWNARRIVNGTDEATKISGYGRTFWAALKAAEVKPPSPPITIEVTVEPLDEDIPAIEPPVPDQPVVISVTAKGKKWVVWAIVAGIIAIVVVSALVAAF